MHKTSGIKEEIRARFFIYLSNESTSKPLTHDQTDKHEHTHTHTQRERERIMGINDDNDDDGRKHLALIGAGYSHVSFVVHACMRACVHVCRKHGVLD